MATLLEEWRAADAVAKAAIVTERDLRAKVIAAFSGVGPMHSGVENVSQWGGTIKIEHKLEYKVIVNNDAVDALLDKIEKSMEGGNIIAERLFRFKPELSVTEYKLLNPANKALVDKAIEIKPASKSVKFVPNGAA